MGGGQLLRAMVSYHPCVLSHLVYVSHDFLNCWSVFCRMFTQLHEDSACDGPQVPWHMCPQNECHALH